MWKSFYFLSKIRRPFTLGEKKRKKKERKREKEKKKKARARFAIYNVWKGRMGKEKTTKAPSEKRPRGRVHESKVNELAAN